MSQNNSNTTSSEYTGYEEWLNQTTKEPADNEVNNMEKEYCKSYILKSHKHLHPLNNINYQPLQGA